jgi:hypothetical protein
MSGREERTPGEESSETPSSDQRISLRVSSRNNEEEEETEESESSSSEIEEAHSHDEHPHDHSDEDISDVVLRSRRRVQRSRHSSEEEEEDDEIDLEGHSSPPDEDEEGDVDVDGEIPVLTSQPLQEEETEDNEEGEDDEESAHPVTHQDVSIQTDDDPHALKDIENKELSPDLMLSPHTSQETQTSLESKDQEVDATPDMKDEEVQNSPLKESVISQASVDREESATQTKPETRDMGTGEYLTHQRSIGINAVDFFDMKKYADAVTSIDIEAMEDKAIQTVIDQKQKDVSFVSVGVGDPLIAEDKGVGDHLGQQDQSIQMAPLMKDESVLMELSAHSIGINPISVHGKDQSIQENIDHQSIGTGSHHSYISGYVQAQMDMINQSIQNDTSRRSIGLDARSFHRSDLSDSSVSRRVSEFMKNQHPPSVHSSISDREKSDLEQNDQFLSKIPLEKSILLEDQMSEEEKYPSPQSSHHQLKSEDDFLLSDRFLFHKNQICGIKNGITYTFFDPKNVLDYFPQQEEHKVSIKMFQINFDDQELKESVLIQSPKSSIDLGIQEEENEEHSSIPSSKLKSSVKEDDESNYSIISSQKGSHGVRSLHSDELEDRR